MWLCWIYYNLDDEQVGNLFLTEEILTYNCINQSPVVAPVEACVKCSKLSSSSLRTWLLRFSSSQIEIESIAKVPIEIYYQKLS